MCSPAAGRPVSTGPGASVAGGCWSLGFTIKQWANIPESPENAKKPNRRRVRERERETQRERERKRLKIDQSIAETEGMSSCIRVVNHPEKDCITYLSRVN